MKGLVYETSVLDPDEVSETIFSLYKMHTNIV